MKFLHTESDSKKLTGWQKKVFDQAGNFLGFWILETLANSYRFNLSAQKERKDYLEDKVTQSIYIS